RSPQSPGGLEEPLQAPRDWGLLETSGAPDPFRPSAPRTSHSPHSLQAGDRLLIAVLLDAHHHPPLEGIPFEVSFGARRLMLAMSLDHDAIGWDARRLQHAGDR